MLQEPPRLGQGLVHGKRAYTALNVVKLDLIEIHDCACGLFYEISERVIACLHFCYFIALKPDGFLLVGLHSRQCLVDTCVHTVSLT